jgi:hypothetical protein
VRNQIVKRVSNRYRYFFDIRNHSQYSLQTGAIRITLLDDKGTEIEPGHASFPYALNTEMGFVRYLDSESGPRGKGDGRVRKFGYEVLLGEPSGLTPGGAIGAFVSDQNEPFQRIGLSVVANGDGLIGSEFEDLSSQTPPPS